MTEPLMPLPETLAFRRILAELMAEEEEDESENPEMVFLLDFRNAPERDADRFHEYRRIRGGWPSLNNPSGDWED